jgi:hypothetical protein
LEHKEIRTGIAPQPRGPNQTSGQIPTATDPLPDDLNEASPTNGSGIEHPPPRP